MQSVHISTKQLIHEYQCEINGDRVFHSSSVFISQFRVSSNLVTNRLLNRGRVSVTSDGHSGPG
jgi:hypothetical protein